MKTKSTTDHESNGNDNYCPMGTKISPAMAVVWDAVCNALGTDTYHLLQQFIYSLIRAASDQHSLTPEIRKLLDALDIDSGWQNAINLCAPEGRLSIAQMILIVEQKDKTGYGAVMIDKPFMSSSMQTENTDQIFERLTEVIYKKHYLRLRRIGASMGVKSVREIIDTLMDAQDLLDLDDAITEGPQMGDQTDFGRKYEYGKQTKRKHHKTPDSINNQQKTIHFSPSDAPDEGQMDWQPHGVEW